MSAATVNTSCVYRESSPQRARVGCIGSAYPSVGPGSRYARRDRASGRPIPGPTLRRVETLLDLLDDAVARFGDRPALGIRHEDGTTATLDLPRAGAQQPRRRVPAPRPRAPARRPAPHLVAVDARSSRRRTSARCAPGSSSSRSTCACRRRRSRASSRSSGATHLVARDRPRRAGSARVRARRLPDVDGRRDRRPAGLGRRRAAAARLGGAGRRVAATRSRTTSSS